MESGNAERIEPPVLSPEEARVLGCLIEKEATTPDVYPADRQRRAFGRQPEDRATR